MLNLVALKQKVKKLQDSESASSYFAAPVEAYILNHTQQAGYEQSHHYVQTCDIWTSNKATPYLSQLSAFATELQAYYEAVERMQLEIDDIRDHLFPRSNDKNQDQDKICQQLDLHPEGLSGMFRKSQQLSFSKQAGYMEPLLPSMRHPNFCLTKKNNREYLLNTQYLIHDFAAICRKMKPHTRTVFVDMGASLIFHSGQHAHTPAFDLIALYQKFGIRFDHIYAYEITSQPAQTVFDKLPDEYQAAFHWINVGVSADPTSLQNPFHLLLENFDPDDLVVVKLDIDAPHLENELALQLTENPQLTSLVDHFYFEHHVKQLELRKWWHPWWGPAPKDSVATSLFLFHALRLQGVASHYWV
jgi:hypothetical protein